MDTDGHGLGKSVGDRANDTLRRYIWFSSVYIRVHPWLNIFPATARRPE